MNGDLGSFSSGPFSRARTSALSRMVQVQMSATTRPTTEPLDATFSAITKALAFRGLCTTAGVPVAWYL